MKISKLLVDNRYETYCMSPRTSIEVFALDAKSKSHNLAPSSWNKNYYLFYYMSHAAWLTVRTNDDTDDVIY